MIDVKQFNAVMCQLAQTRPGSPDAHELLRQLVHLSLDVLFSA